MKQHTFHAPHHCRSIKNDDFTCTHAFVTPRPMIKCNGNCFQRNSCQQTPYTHHPVHRYSCSPNICPTYYPIPPTIVQPWYAMPSNCNPSFNYPFHASSCSKNIKSIDPSSYRVTVRRITPSDVAAAATEAYRARRNGDSDQIHLRKFNRIITTNHQQIKTTQTTNLSDKDHRSSDDQDMPSVPSKKIVSKNDGTQVSSTSFITTTDDQNSYFDDSVSDQSSEHIMKHGQTVNKLSSSITEVAKSNTGSFSLSEHNSVLPNSNTITPELPLSQIIMNRKEDMATKGNLDNVSNESQITRHIESKRKSITNERSSIQSQPTINKAEKHEWYSLEEKISPLEIVRDDMSNESSVDITEPTIDLSSFIISHPPTLPSSFPPNINIGKSNERLLHSSRSVKSITSLNKEKQKSSTDISTSNLPLRTARSILDFGLLIDEATT